MCVHVCLPIRFAFSIITISTHCIVLGYLIIVIIIFLYGMVDVYGAASLFLVPIFIRIEKERMEVLFQQQQKNVKIEESFCLEFVYECLCLCLF